MLKITIKGLDMATTQVQAAVSTGVQNALNVAGGEGERLVKEAISSPFLGRPNAIATGDLVNSITFQVSQEAGISRTTVFAAGLPGQYAGYVEAGTGRHFPPPSALLLWVEKKFGIKNQKEAMAIAVRVAWGIYHRGTPGFGMFAHAFAKLEPQLLGIFQAQIAKAIEAAGAAK